MNKSCSVNPKLAINSKSFFVCNDNDPFCLSELYSINPDGTANINQDNNNSNNNVLYNNDFFNKPNLSFINCPTNFKPIKLNDNFICSYGTNLCNPNNSDKNNIQGIPNCNYNPNNSDNKLLYTNSTYDLADCLKDCKNESECTSLSSINNLDSSFKCFYYNIPLNDISSSNNNIVQNNNRTIVVKNNCYNPFNITDINNNYPSDPNANPRNIITRPNSMNYSISTPSTKKYNISDNSNNQSNNNSQSNDNSQSNNNISTYSNINLCPILDQQKEDFNINELNTFGISYNLLYLNILAIIIMTIIISNIIIRNQLCAKFIILPIIVILGSFFINLFININYPIFFAIYFLSLIYLYYINCFTF